MTNPEIISMVVHNGALYVATKNGVYIKDANGEFHRLMIEDMHPSASHEQSVLLQKQAA